jgi:hypothetical protein
MHSGLTRPVIIVGHFLLQCRLNSVPVRSVVWAWGGGEPEEDVIVGRSRMKPGGSAGMGYVGAVGVGVGMV